MRGALAILRGELRSTLRRPVQGLLMLFLVLLPAALPNILSGLKVVFAICWTCVISAEIVGTQKGLGSLVWGGMEIGNTSQILVGIASIGIVVLVLDALIGVLERKLVPWMYLHREDA